MRNRKNLMVATYSELIRAGVEIEKIRQTSPALGYIVHQHLKYEANDELLGVIKLKSKSFDIYEEKVGEIYPESPFAGIVKSGDLIMEIHGAKISYIGGKKVYIKDETVFTRLDEFITEGETIDVMLSSPSRSTKTTQRQDPKAAFNANELYEEPRTEKVKVEFLYSISEKNTELMSKLKKARVSYFAEFLKGKLFNQDAAIDRVYKSIKIFFAGLKDESKPIGNYLLVGPTGTGKTELAKLLAQKLGFSLVRIDMSEYGERHTVSRLIGSPPSYVGYGDKTILETEIGNSGKKVVLLLDEMEKSHPDLQKIFLQAMDNSRITLANGVEVNFKNTLILMTSNLGTVVKSNVGITETESVLSVNMDTIRQGFLPEFIGRLTGVIEFNPLNKDHAKLILGKFIDEFNQVQMKEKNCTVKISEAAQGQLISKGFNQMYGARPLKTALQGEIFEKIADLFLFGEQNGSTEIEVDWSGSEFTAKFVPIVMEETITEQAMSQFETI